MKKILFLFLLLFAAPAFATPPLGNPIVSLQSSSTEGSHVFKASQGWLNGFDATSGAVAGYIMLIDSATVPSDGSVTPKFCYALSANNSISISYIDYPAPFANGITIVFSTTGCFTKTVSSTAFFDAQVQ